MLVMPVSVSTHHTPCDVRMLNITRSGMSTYVGSKALHRRILLFEVPPWGENLLDSR